MHTIFPGRNELEPEPSPMLGESLDLQLEHALEAIRERHWGKARDLLAARLEAASQLGRRRLTLYLLSVTASSAGHPETGDQFAQAARSVPIELSEPRFFGANPEGELSELELGWWTFNGWGVESTHSLPLEGHDPKAPLPWADILDSTVEGRAGELERRWSGVLESEHPQRALLWNLVALAYLEQGDPRTYDEMRQSAPKAQEVPNDLRLLLEQAGLNSAVQTLLEGRWLTSDLLQNESPARVPTDDSSVDSWTEEMEEAFSLLAVGRAQEAARKFGPLCDSPYSSSQQGYALRALALALTDSGEYGPAEETLAESHALLEQHPDTALETQYCYWLESARGEMQQAAPESENSPAEFDPHQDFWFEYESALKAMKQSHLDSAKQSLRRLLSLQVPSADTTSAFLVSLLFAGVAILEGDHIEAQDAIEEATRQAESAPLSAALLHAASQLFLASGAETVGAKLHQEKLSGLDPWRDFPADFASPTLSEFF